MMKHLLSLIVAGSFSGALIGQTILIDDDLESYVSGDLIAETAGLPWSTWSVAPGAL